MRAVVAIRCQLLLATKCDNLAVHRQLDEAAAMWGQQMADLQAACEQRITGRVWLYTCGCLCACVCVCGGSEAAATWGQQMAHLQAACKQRIAGRAG